MDPCSVKSPTRLDQPLLNPLFDNCISSDQVTPESMSWDKRNVPTVDRIARNPTVVCLRDEAWLSDNTLILKNDNLKQSAQSGEKYQIRHHVNAEPWSVNEGYVDKDFPPVYCLYQSDQTLSSDFALRQSAVDKLKQFIITHYQLTDISGIDDCLANQDHPITSTHKLSLKKAQEFFQTSGDWELSLSGGFSDEEAMTGYDPWVMLPFHYGIHLFRVLSKCGVCEISRDLRAIDFKPKDNRKAHYYLNHRDAISDSDIFYFALPPDEDHRGPLIRYFTYSERHTVLNAMVNHNGYIINDSSWDSVFYRVSSYWSVSCLTMKALSTLCQDIFYFESALALAGFNINFYAFSLVVAISTLDAMQTFLTRFEKQKVAIANALLYDRLNCDSSLQASTVASVDMAAEKLSVDRFNTSVALTTLIQGLFVYGFFYRSFSRVVEDDSVEKHVSLVLSSWALSSCVAYTFYQYRSGEEYYDRFLSALKGFYHPIEYFQLDFWKMLSVTIAVLTQVFITLFNANATFFYSLDTLFSLGQSDYELEGTMGKWGWVVGGLFAVLFTATISFPIAGSGIREIDRSAKKTHNHDEHDSQSTCTQPEKILGIVFDNNKPSFRLVRSSALTASGQYGLNILDALTSMSQQVTALAAVTRCYTPISWVVWGLLSALASYPLFISSQHNLWQYNPRVRSSLRDITEAYNKIKSQEDMTENQPGVDVSLKLIKKVLCCLRMNACSLSNLKAHVLTTYFDPSSRRSSLPVVSTEDRTDSPYSDLTDRSSSDMDNADQSSWHKVLAFLLVQVEATPLPIVSSDAVSCCDVTTYQSLMIQRTYRKRHVVYADQMREQAEMVADRISSLMGRHRIRENVSAFTFDCGRDSPLADTAGTSGRI